jgi:hypothetical protein
VGLAAHGVCVFPWQAPGAADLIPNESQGTIQTDGSYGASFLRTDGFSDLPVRFHPHSDRQLFEVLENGSRVFGRVIPDRHQRLLIE